jgi:hypothetical protein
MAHAEYIQIKIDSFKKLTGCDLDHFTAHVTRGDAWGTFMKLATVIEATAKRAIAMKLGADPNSEGVMRIEFYNALLLCNEAKLISNEAFAYANYIRHVRNDLVHSGGALDLNVEQLRGSAFFKKYQDKIEAFVSIQNTMITDGIQQHINTLLLGCVGFVSEIAKNLLGEEWVITTQEEPEGV